MTASDIPVPPAVRGATMRWSWTDGPTKGKVHEHVFHEDGTVEWREVGGAEPRSGGAPGRTPERVPYGAFEVAPGIYAVSYLAGSGYTLTVVLNRATGQVVGFASASEAWYPCRGTLEWLSRGA